MAHLNFYYSNLFHIPSKVGERVRVRRERVFHLSSIQTWATLKLNLSGKLHSLIIYIYKCKLQILLIDYIYLHFSWRLNIYLVLFVNIDWFCSSFNFVVKIDLMVEAKDKLSSHWWWLDSQKKGTLNRSPWLQSTLSGESLQHYNSNSWFTFPD